MEKRKYVQLIFILVQFQDWRRKFWKKEREMIQYISYYFILINMIGLFVMRADKQRAIRHQFRISERTIWMIAIFGGAIGTTMGMNLYRHKTKHLSFKIGFPLLAVVDVLLYIYCLI